MQWCLLIISSLCLGLLFFYFHIPAALLIGPMIVGIVFSLFGATILIHIRLFTLALAILGCMVAQTLSPAILIPLKSYWLVIVIVTVFTLCASTFSGWFLIRFSPLQGATAAWGTTPGAASAMVAMSADYGADMRLVAFIQYLRVLIVITTTAVVAHLMTFGELHSIRKEVIWFPSLSLNFIITIIIGMLGAWLGRRLAIPSGAMLLPMITGALCQSTGVMTIELPQWLLAFAYATIGLSVGLRFNLTVLRLALRALPQIIMSIVILMSLCTLSAWGLHYATSVDFLSAFLATSPGGVDTVAIIAAGTGADLPLIISIQTLRLFSVVLLGPFIARLLSRKARKTRNIYKANQKH